MSTAFSASPNEEVKSSVAPNNATTAAVCLSVTTNRKHFAFDQRERIKKRRKQLNPVRLSLDYIHFDESSLNEKDDDESNLDTDSSSDKHINYSYSNEPSTSFKTEPITPPVSVSEKCNPDTLPSCNSNNNNNNNNNNNAVDANSVPLNLTKNSHSETITASSIATATDKAGAVYNSRNVLVDRTALDLKADLYSSRKEDQPGVRNEIPVKYAVKDQSNADSAAAVSANYEHFMINAFNDEKLQSKEQQPSPPPPPFPPRTPPVSVMRNLFTNAITRTSCRIFNPEAFCNICNKEFCNKYFLKTHKANKHGVYCENKDNAVDVDPLPPNAVPLMFTWNVKNNNVKLPNNPYLFNANAVKDSSAFCNICEKEFCNKYFLRRHKEKMHGIVSFGESGRKSDASLSDTDNKCNEFPMDEDKDNGRVPTANQIEEKYSNFYHELATSRKNELNQNLKTDSVASKTALTREGKLKYPKYSTNTTNVVSDFIKVCLTNNSNNNVTGMTNSAVSAAAEPRPHSNDNAATKDNETAINLMKRDSEFNQVPVERDFNHRYETSPSRNQQNVPTGDFGVQAKEEDFHEYDEKGSKTANRYHQPPAKEELLDEKYTCDFCKKSLTTYVILKLHQKYVHSLNVDGSVEDETEFKHMESVYFMILKFSWLNTVVTFCEICKTEFEKNDVLEMHLMNKHGSLVDELSRIIEDAGVNGLLVPALNVGDGKILCQICNKTFTNNASFQQHVYEKCNLPDIKDYSEYFPSLSLDDSASDSSKTRNFCEICKKELCNKYFMKTHMRRMHGISIQNGVRIGGVTCEICNKELCSKYFLRVHKKNCHGIMENVQFAKLLVNQQPATAGAASVVAAAGADEREEFPQKHVSQVCSVCGRIFKSMKWLKTHLFNDHGKLGASVWQDILVHFNSNDLVQKEDTNSTPHTGTGSADRANESPSPRDMSQFVAVTLEPDEKPQLYQCSRCQFQAASAEVLIAHQRLHAKNAVAEAQYLCMYCSLIAKDKISLEEHIAYHHFTRNSSDFQGNSVRRFHSGKSILDVETHSQYEIAVKNGNCNRVIEFDRSN